jgi:hypothetical protein
VTAAPHAETGPFRLPRPADIGARESDGSRSARSRLTNIRRVDLRLDVDGDHSDARALTRWLMNEEDLRGRVRRVAGVTDPEAMGTAADIVVPLAEAFAAGALTALAESLVNFVAQRRSRRVTVEVQDGRETLFRIEVRGGDDPQALAGELARIAAARAGGARAGQAGKRRGRP